MSNLTEGANSTQLSDIVKYISDNIKIPILGAGGGFAPIGTESYIEGTTAPQGWILCDGSVLNIADYPELATYYASHYGASNHFGGDGVTTFATPVMNGMPNGGVETPDEHVVGEWRKTIDGVLKYKPIYKKTLEKLQFNATGFTEIPHNISNFDKVIDLSGHVQRLTGYQFPLPCLHTAAEPQWGIGCNGVTDTIISFNVGTGNTGQYALDPNSLYITLYYIKTTDQWQTVQEGHSSDGNGVFCVKATVSDTELNNMHVYSPNEHQVGWWQEVRDGVLKQKPVYQKTLSNTYGTISSSITSLDVGQITSDNSIDAVIDMNVTATYSGSTVTLQYFDAGSPLSTFTNYYYYNNHIGSRSNNTGASNALIRATVQYTKSTDQWQTV